MKKDLLGLQNLSREDLLRILENAKRMKEVVLSEDDRLDNLAGRSVVTLFYENSTRTRLSFELAAKYLGADVANITASGSSVEKGESLIDTVKTIDAMGTDIIAMRHSSSGAPQIVAPLVDASVINAGDGMHEHPTQALLDIFTIMEKKGSIAGLKVAIVGDIEHSRVVRSNIYALKTLGADVSLGGPSTLIPKGMEKLGVKVFKSVQEAMIDADVVMALRIQLERQKSGLFPSLAEYNRFFGIDEKRLMFAKDDAFIMHPGPVNRGVELSSEIVDGDRSAICRQVTNGVAVRMSVMDWLINGSEEDAQ